MNMRTKVVSAGSEEIEESDLPNNFFGVIDPTINELDLESEDLVAKSIAFAKITVLSDASSEAYQHLLRSGKLESAKKLVGEHEKLKDTNNDTILFHYAFQYGFSTGSSIMEATTRVFDLLDKVQSKEGKGGNDKKVITDAQLVNVIIDKDAGFLQIKAGDFLLTFNDAAKIEVMEV